MLYIGRARRTAGLNDGFDWTLAACLGWTASQWLTYP
jgi:hypothetical protein